MEGSPSQAAEVHSELPMATPVPPREDVTHLLALARDGDGQATSELLPIVYAELRALAGSFFRTPNPSRTLQPTALVHEAYIKLVQAPGQEWEGRRHFFAVAAKAMRQVLVNHARDRRARKRGGPEAGGGGGHHRITLAAAGELADSAAAPRIVDLLALEDALTGLEHDYPDQCRVVELKFFGGLTNEEAAAVMGVSVRTIEREWRMAKAELRLRLGEGEAAEASSDP